MLLINAWVGPSRVDGLGLIARDFIPKGTKVWQLQPGFDIILSQEEVNSLSPTAKQQILHYGFYLAEIDRWVLSGDDDRFTNHSDKANCHFHGKSSIAIQDIEPGSEIFDNYREFNKDWTHDTRNEPAER
jgi:SET domain-containing protein